jgi:pyruvate formate lyase activating enzyme
VTAFHPDYKMNAPPRTPASTLFEARRIGLDAGLRYVYAGNLAGQGGENTHCPECGQVLIERFGFHVIQNRLEGGACPKCRASIPGFWTSPAKGGKR